MNKIDVNKALKLLNNDYVLEAYEGNRRLIFIKENNKIKVASNSFLAHLNPYDFLEIYSSLKFYLIEENKEELDFSKDAEYYNKLQKRQ